MQNTIQIFNQSKTLTNKEKIQIIEKHFREIMLTLGLDLSDPSLEKTPERVAKMYVNEIFSSLDPKNYPSLTQFPHENLFPETKQMVFVKVPFTSFCEHHFLPMTGTAYIGYIPNKKVLGLSKLSRIVRFFSKKPQMQERLTQEIAKCLLENLETEDIAVSMKAVHFCMIARGVEETESETTTQVFLGDFQSNESLKNEFFQNMK